MELIIAAGYVPVIGAMYAYANQQYYIGRQDEREDYYEEAARAT